MAIARTPAAVGTGAELEDGTVVEEEVGAFAHAGGDRLGDVHFA